MAEGIRWIGAVGERLFIDDEVFEPGTFIDADRLSRLDRDTVAQLLANGVWEDHGQAQEIASSVNSSVNSATRQALGLRDREIAHRVRVAQVTLSRDPSPAEIALITEDI